MAQTFIQTHVEFPSESDGGKIWAWLDDESNQGADEFPYGGRACFLLAAHPENMDINIQVSDGQWTRENAGSNQVTETVWFNRTDEATVRYPIAAIDGQVWKGRSLGGIRATGGCGIKSEIIGVAELQITYTYNFTRYSVLLPDRPPQNQSDTWPVLVSIKGGKEGDESNPETSLKITFQGGVAGLADYYLYVVDDCTDEALGGVTVVFDDEEIGSTDANGRIYVGRLPVASRHTVRIEHPGYRLFLATTQIPEQEEDTAEIC